MKRIFSPITVICLLLVVCFFSSCMKDMVKQSYTYTLYRPVYKTTAEVRANIKSNPSEAVSQPGKLFIKGNYIFLNEVDKGIHVIDNSNPAQPRNVAFIDIPGNVDLAVRGNTLYADLYTDLITLDITNPLDVRVTKILENAFPHRYYNQFFALDTTQIVTEWITKDTTVTEEYKLGSWNTIERWGVVNAMVSSDRGNFANSAAPAAAAPTGKGGSMARFTIVDNRLYTVGHQELKVFNINNATEPVYVSEKTVGFGIETLFPFKDRLFIGSINGMFIYNITNPDQPTLLSQFTHVQSCDPVIADDVHAYVTLRSGTVCNGFTNQLEVLDVSNLQAPSLVKTYPMTHPHGLSKDGDLLFICDGHDGLKVYNAAKPEDLKLIKTIGGIETFDVIAYNGIAIVVAKDGLYQFDYTDRNNIRQLSKIRLN